MGQLSTAQDIEARRHLTCEYVYIGIEERELKHIQILVGVTRCDEGSLTCFTLYFSAVYDANVLCVRVCVFS